MADIEVRVATEDDLDGIVEVLASAFVDDPFWGWAFPGGEKIEEWWRFLAGSALRYPWTWVAGDFVAVSVWIPPGGIELTPAEEELMEPLLIDLLGDRAGDVKALAESFDLNSPDGPPYYYLSLLGVHESHRGRGIGMGLLADNLATIDRIDGLPAYLESSNPANDVRYERLGFERIGQIERPDGQATASTMWRDGRPSDIA